jgi:hypothetical protein
VWVTRFPIAPPGLVAGAVVISQRDRNVISQCDESPRITMRVVTAPQRAVHFDVSTGGAFDPAVGAQRHKYVRARPAVRQNGPHHRQRTWRLALAPAPMNLRRIKRSRRPRDASHRTLTARRASAAPGQTCPRIAR